jgi:uncharacterized protein YbaR (Trm112 family)
MKECPNCKGDKLSWAVDKRGPSDVTDGRLRMSEISVIGYLYCEECSETLGIIEEHEVTEMLNKCPKEMPP